MKLKHINNSFKINCNTNKFVLPMINLINGYKSKVIQLKPFLANKGYDVWLEIIEETF